MIDRSDNLGPLESAEPVRGYAIIRIALSLTALVCAAALDFEDDGLLALLLGVVFLPIGILILVLAQQRPSFALNPFVAALDVASLALILALVPASWAAIHFSAMVLTLVYPLVSGERRGVVFAIAAVLVLVPITLVSGTPPPLDRLIFYEAVFAVATISGALLAGRIAAAQALARERAGELTRRTIEAGYEARREVAQSLHDGPVQELVAADMKIEGAMHASARGDHPRTQMLLDEAREVVERNIRAIRSELVALGPMAFDELTFQEAVENCAPAWARRYHVEVRTDLVRLDMPNEVCGALFGIAQEAVANAGRHAGAHRVDLTLSQTDGIVELLIRDDGAGFGDVNPLGSREPGHIGLASMRERAAIAGGDLAIDSSPGGTEVRVRLPTPA